MGELIALDQDSVYVLLEEGLRTASVDSVWRARLFFFDSNWGELSAWSVLGFFSTPSHGWYAPLTGVLLWLLPGTTATSGRSREPMIVYTRGHDSMEFLLKEMPKYARFPQGFPEAVRRSEI